MNPPLVDTAAAESKLHEEARPLPLPSARERALLTMRHDLLPG
jgi:hypothetical protein